MSDFTSHPKPNTVILAAELAEHFEKLLSYQNRSETPFALVTSGANLNYTIQAGKAYVHGYEVGESGDASFAGTLSPSATNHIYIQQDGTVVSNTTGTPPANSYKLFTATTNGTGTTSTTDEQTDTIEFDDPLVVQTLESLGFLKGLHLRLAQTDPYVRLHDTNTGTIRRIWLVGTELRVTDDSGGTVYTQDLASISNPVDETDTNAVKDKTVSNLLAKGWQDTKTTVDAATNNATVNTLVKRDASGRFKAAAASASTDVAIKSQVDSVQTNLTNHEAASDPHSAAGYIKADGSRAFTGNQSMGSNKLTNLAAPTSGSDAARKSDVDLKVNKAGDTMTGTLSIANSAPILILKDSDGTGDSQMGYVSLQDSGNVEKAWFGFGTNTNDDFEIRNNYAGGHVVLSPGAGGQARVGANLIWHDGNDGAGSGLDADRLDGIQGSQFLRADQSLDQITGTLYSTNDSNSDGPNFDVQTITKSIGEYAYKVTRGGSPVAGFFVDGDLDAVNIDFSGVATGNGSGLTNVNAATLDGLDSTQFLRGDAADIKDGLLEMRGDLEMGDAGANSYEIRFRSQAASGSGELAMRAEGEDFVIYEPEDANREWLRIRDGGEASPATALQIYGWNVWHQGNDGAGSGLDADTVDGYQPATGTGVNTIARRDSSGRIQAAAPSADSDVATFETVQEHALLQSITYGGI